MSYTSTIEGSFGSGLMVGGYYLNNELTDFSFSPTKDGMPVANRVEGGKRPRSSMAPTVVYDADGKLVIAIGAAGGATIPVQVAKTLIGDARLGTLRAGCNRLAGALFARRHDRGRTGTMLAGMIPALEALGHAKVMARGHAAQDQCRAARCRGLDRRGRSAQGSRRHG